MLYFSILDCSFDYFFDSKSLEILPLFTYFVCFLLYFLKILTLAILNSLQDNSNTWVICGSASLAFLFITGHLFLPQNCPLFQLPDAVYKRTTDYSSSLCSVQFSSVAQSCPTLCDPMNRSTPGLPVHHQLSESIESVMPSSHLILCPAQPASPPALNPSQHQSLFQ